jgi:hypothetical protein
MKLFSILFAFLAWSILAAEPASAAIKFKRFAPCAEGVVTVKTCECHAGTSGRYHFCHAGNSCDTNTGSATNSSALILRRTLHSQRQDALRRLIWIKPAVGAAPIQV